MILAALLSLATTTKLVSAVAECASQRIRANTASSCSPICLLIVQRTIYPTYPLLILVFVGTYPGAKGATVNSQTHRNSASEHGKFKPQCVECGGSSICEHKKQKASCVECGGSRICEHGKQKASCKECLGNGPPRRYHATHGKQREQPAGLQAPTLGIGV